MTIRKFRLSSNSKTQLQMSKTRKKFLIHALNDVCGLGEGLGICDVKRERSKRENPPYMTLFP